MRGTVTIVNAASSSESSHVQNSSDPGCPLYSDAHFMCGSMSRDDTAATCASVKSSFSSAYASVPIAIVVNPAVTTIARRAPSSSAVRRSRCPSTAAATANSAAASAVSSAEAPIAAVRFTLVPLERL